MYMLLMGLCFTFFAVAVTAVAFAASTRPSPPLPPVQPELPAAKASPARFFADQAAAPIPVPPQVPIEVLLQQIENHIRLEQAAAESFIAYPTQALLHSKTSSPFVN